MFLLSKFLLKFSSPLQIFFLLDFERRLSKKKRTSACLYCNAFLYLLLVFRVFYFSGKMQKKRLNLKIDGYEVKGMRSKKKYKLSVVNNWLGIFSTLFP